MTTVLKRARETETVRVEKDGEEGLVHLRTHTYSRTASLNTRRRAKRLEGERERKRSEEIRHG